MPNFGTRANSPRLSVATLLCIASAVAAINRSCAPMNCPLDASVAMDTTIPVPEVGPLRIAGSVAVGADGVQLEDWTVTREGEAGPGFSARVPLTLRPGESPTTGREPAGAPLEGTLVIGEASWVWKWVAKRTGVEFVDGSVMAQLSPPDMRLPIQYALTYPERVPGPTLRLDVTRPWSLDFEPPDPERFPALALGTEVAARGGTTGAVLNAANEAAVDRFLAGTLGFTQIAQACRAVLDRHHYEPAPTLETLLRLDRWAREEMQQWNRS